MRKARGIALAGRLVCLALGAAAVSAADAAVAAPAPYTEPAFAAIVHRYDGCLADLPPADRTLLEQRFGAAGVSVAAAAAQLHTTPVALHATELAAIRRLERLHRAGRCAANTTTPTTVVASAPAAASRPTAAAPAPAVASSISTSSGLSWTSPTELALLAVIVIALGALLYGVRRDFGPQRHDGGRFSLRRRDR